MNRVWTLPTETWVVPATPAAPLDQVEDRVLLDLARVWGRLGHVAACKFASVLPEIHRRGLFRKAGYCSIYELASRLGSLSAETVDDILRLHRHIGQYDCLWGLLSGGIVGWSKLSKIEDLVTSDTAGWFARLVQEAPKSSVERIASRARARLRSLSGDPSRSINARVRLAHLTIDLLDAARSEGDEPAASTLSAASAAVPTAGAPDDPESLEGAALGDDFRHPGPKRTSLELSPLCRELGDRLLADYRRRGIAVSLGQLVELALRIVWASGDLPLPDDVPCGGEDPSSSPGASESPGAGVAEGGAGNPRAGREVAGKLRTVPISRHKILAVVISVAETGESWMRTHSGLVPVRLADLSGLAPVVQIVPMAEVAQRLEAKAGASRGKGILADTRLFVAATSGLHCQAGGCNRPVVHVHHGKPRAEGLDHGPSNVYGLCEACHKARHGDLVLNPDDHPADWVMVSPGERPDPNRVDRACQALRRKAAAAGFRVA